MRKPYGIRVAVERLYPGQRGEKNDPVGRGGREPGCNHETQTDGVGRRLLGRSASDD